MRFWLSSNKVLLVIAFLFLCTQFNFDYILQVLNTCNNNTTVVYFLKKICMSLFLFVIGVFTYLKILSNNLKIKINKLTFFEILVICFPFFLVLKLLLPLLITYLLGVEITEVGLYQFLGDANSSNNSGSNLDRIGDATIMTASLAAAQK